MHTEQRHEQTHTLDHTGEHWKDLRDNVNNNFISFNEKAICYLFISSVFFVDNKKYLDVRQSRPLNNHLSLQVNKSSLRSSSL